MIKEGFKKACLCMLEPAGDRPKQGISRNYMEGVHNIVDIGLGKYNIHTSFDELCQFVENLVKCTNSLSNL